MVAVGLAAILGVALLQLAMAGARLYARGQARANLQNAGLISLSHLSRELKSAAGATVTVWTGDSPRTDAAFFYRPDLRSGSIAPYLPAAHHVVVFRERSSGRLIRGTRPLTSSGTRLAPEELRQACQTAAPADRVLCGYVAVLALEQQPDALLLTLRLEQPIRNGWTARETVGTRVAFRNRT